MAKQHITQLVDDLDGTVLEDGVTITFSLEGRAYEIDLSEGNAQTLRDAFAPFVEAGRSVNGPASRGSSRPRRTSRSGGRDLGAIRAWASENGHTVNSRGRIPAAVVEAYDAAH